MTPPDSTELDPDAGPARPRQRITARALLEFRRLSAPRLHPDGQRVAFVVTEPDFDESRYVSHVWLTEHALPEEPAQGPDGETSAVPPISGTDSRMSPHPESAGAPEGERPAEQDGEQACDATRQLTFSHDGETEPRWSPDGRFLAFVSLRPDETEPLPDAPDDEEPKEQVWILPVEGGEARKVTSAREGVLQYAWTPDSKSLIYMAPEPRCRPIESVRKEDRDRRKIDPIVEHEERLRRQFWKVDVEERKAKLLYTGDYGVLEFALSPDAERICFTTNRTGDWNDYHEIDLMLAELSTGRSCRLTDRSGGKTNPRWSPDGRRIVFLTWLDESLSYSRQTLFEVNVPPVADSPPSEPVEIPDAGVCRQVTEPGFDVEIIEFEWCQHDGVLYAAAVIGTGSEVYAIGEGTERIDLGGKADRSDIGVDSGGCVLVYVEETERALPEIFLRDEQGAVHQLTRLNADFSENHRLPRQEVICWKSDDGLSIEGVLTYPSDAGERAPYPLILQIHGGPKGQSTNTLTNYGLAPVWAAEGYAVLQPNFRGSEGYGDAFATANRRDLGGGDFRDIMAGVDWCIEQGIADPGRLGVMGGSYGGYMTNWIIGHTDRFRAAVSMFGIFHLQTDYSNSDLSRWDNDYLGAYYWEDPEIYRRLSPGSYVEKIKTPTLIIHGDDDNNTFISNSKELYQALRHRGVKTQFVHYPREGHGVREPNHKLDEVRRCLAWMDGHVRHGGRAPGVYRIGDRIPDEAGTFELRVVRADIASFVGQPKPEEGANATILLEVVLTIASRDAPATTGPLTLALSDLRLESRNSEDAALPMERPIGIPLDVPGGKVLIEGQALRCEQHPDPDTGQLAFGLAAVFRVPKSGGDCLLRVASFPPVAIVWAADGEGESAGEPTWGPPHALLPAHGGAKPPETGAAPV